MILTDKDRRLTAECLKTVLKAGADKARICLSDSRMELVGTLDGELDRITSCRDRLLTIYIYADGRYGSFSTNKTDPESLRDFVYKSVDTVRMMEEDRFHDLPSPERLVRDAITGDELGILDLQAYLAMTPQDRIRIALDAAAKERSGKGWKMISEEGEYDDSLAVTYLLDSNGLEALHAETVFEYGTEITLEDSRGRKYSGGWWDAAPSLAGFHPEIVAPAAFEEARMQFNPHACRSGKYTMVVDSEVASKMVSPILGALNAFAIQQKNSFLTDSCGKRLFPEGLTIMDIPRTPGQIGGKYFDSEGVATHNHAIIENGVVKEYFVNTYMAGKLGIAPTSEEAIRPKVLPYLAPSFKGCDRAAIMASCGDGILVTDFEGGNNNPATGDFSYAIRGYRFREGKIVHPVNEMLITGNFLSLWGKLLAAGDDARICREKLIPTLAFAEVDFSG